METLDCIKTRRSIRKFTDRPVDRAVLEKLVNIAAFSPSWKNSQPVRYVAITDPALAVSFAQALPDGAAKAVLPALEEKTLRQKKRRQEARAHQRNVRKGKKQD